MQLIDWTTDPVLRELFGEMQWMPGERDTIATGEPPTDRIGRGLKRLLDHVIESFAVYGCAMSAEYHDPAALFPPRPMPARRARASGACLRHRLGRLGRDWRARRRIGRATPRLDTLDDRLLRDIGLRRDQLHEAGHLRLPPR